jgi:hypothetical protein
MHGDFIRETNPNRTSYVLHIFFQYSKTDQTTCPPPQTKKTQYKFQNISYEIPLLNPLVFNSKQPMKYWDWHDMDADT